MSITDRLTDLPVLFHPLALSELDDAKRIAIAQIDAVLPQTQCGLCGHHDGCLPYAHGIVTGADAINLCVPGGQAVTDAIAKIMDVKLLPASQSKWRTDPATLRPIEVRAIISESDCIGCTKCIPACPVDAIIGTAKHMHSIITDLCTGCELCLAPCPVDCIDLVEYPRHIDDDERIEEQAHLRKRYHHHLNRVAKTIEDGTKPVVSIIESQMVNVLNSSDTPVIDETTAKNTIAAAKLRTQIKKLNKQLAAHPSDDLTAKLDVLNAQLAELESSP